MICIHPTAAHEVHTLTQLQRATGLRVARGRTFLRLVPWGGEGRRASRPGAVTTILPPIRHNGGYTPGPNDGGSAA